MPRQRSEWRLPDRTMTSLTSLINIGPQSDQWLESIGIDSAEEFFDLGVVETYRLVKGAYPDRVSLNLFYALLGAYMDLNWKELPQGVKSDLLSQIGEQ